MYSDHSRLIAGVIVSTIEVGAFSFESLSLNSFVQSFLASSSTFLLCVVVPTLFRAESILSSQVHA